MSLFKNRPFWSIICDVDEKFDQNSLEVSKMNDENDRIIIGSHSGILRIYQPSTELNQDDVLKDFQPSDLLIEKLFKEPILQVSSGRLVSGSAKLYVAVLYPRSVAVYGLVTKEGATEHGTQNMLPLIYEHKLKRASANFCVGPFGGIPTRDFICVQSLDGLLIFFEQESFGFCSFLPEFLLPGPLIYAAKSDSFVTVSSSWCLTSFRYKSLSEAGHNSKDDECTGTRAKSSWSYNLGEEVIDLQYTIDTNNVSYILVLGTRNLYCLSENGVTKFMKRLDYVPICFYVYTLGDCENPVWSLVVSETNTLLIYQNTTLKWAIQLSFLPIAIKRGFFKNVQGALVLLSDDGRLNCSYLGTEPHLFSTTPLVQQDLDYEQAEAELASLTRIIRNHYNNDRKVVNSTAEKELQIFVNVKSMSQQTCNVLVTLTPNVILEEVQVTVTVSKPLKCTKQILFYKNLAQKVELDTNIFVGESLPCPNLTMEVVISYISNVGIPKVVRKVENLPLKMLTNYCEKSRDCTHKIVLSVHKEPVLLQQLFPEFSLRSDVTKIGLNSAIENFEFNASITVSANEYQISADSLTMLNVVVLDLVVRLRDLDYVVSYTENLPVPELFQFVKKHFEQIYIVKDLQKKLNLLSGEFRVIQKKLISKFKDKNPTSLSNMEVLLERSYLQIVDYGTQLESELKNLAKSQIELSALLHLFLTLLGTKSVDKNILPVIETTFCPSVHDSDTQIWENVFETSLCYLLHTIFSKSESDKIKVTAFEEVKDLNILEAHVVQLLDRIKEPHTNLKTEESETPVENETSQVKSTFSEFRPRVVSAKKRLTEYV